jgi:hypothetical protein
MARIGLFVAVICLFASCGSASRDAPVASAPQAPQAEPTNALAASPMWPTDCGAPGQRSCGSQTPSAARLGRQECKEDSDCAEEGPCLRYRCDGHRCVAKSHATGQACYSEDAHQRGTCYSGLCLATSSQRRACAAYAVRTLLAPWQAFTESTAGTCAAAGTQAAACEKELAYARQQLKFGMLSSLAVCTMVQSTSDDAPALG